MLLFNGKNLSKSFGPKTLFRNINLSIFVENRIGLIGKNGSGKSTLLNIIADQESADQGTITRKRGLKIGFLPQTCDFSDQTPLEILLDTLRHSASISDYDRERIALMWLNKLGFSGKEKSAAVLSGGWKKRLMLAQQMISSPDLLLLDEPTNHLDLESVLWLENFLLREAPTYLLVSHDRYFLQHTANHIFELDPSYPQGLLAIQGSYEFFLEKKESFLQGQLEQERSLASQARREIAWLRSNAKARTTKSRARTDQAHALLEDLSTIRKRNEQRKAAIHFTSSERDTRKLLVAKNLTKQLGDKTLFQGLDFIIGGNTRMGLMGPNGAGKTTLLKILAGELESDQGTLKRADQLRTIYFDQHRNQLPLDMSLRDALAPHGDFVTFQGQQIHVNGWCKRFLFSPDILDLPIGKLSGGERARIAIAHLMLQPADLLLLDEPTNDLDIPTLETFESSLLDFTGAIVLITHDRCLLDRLCNIVLALGHPNQTAIFADYSQWETATKDSKMPITTPKAQITAAPAAQNKLSYQEKKEYNQIENKITQLEEERKQLTALLEDFTLTTNSDHLNKICHAIGLVETQIEQLYIRWEQLEQKQSGCK